MSDDLDHVEATRENHTESSGAAAAVGDESTSDQVEHPKESDLSGHSLAELIGIWGEVLGSSEIDEEASFLAQGGESLTAMRVVNRVRARFGVRLPLPILLSGSTARDIAAHIDSETAKNEVSRP